MSAWIEGTHFLHTPPRMALTHYTTRDISFVTTFDYFQTSDRLLILRTEDTDMGVSTQKKNLEIFSRFVIEWTCQDDKMAVQMRRNEIQ